MDAVFHRPCSTKGRLYSGETGSAQLQEAAACNGTLEIGNLDLASASERQESDALRVERAAAAVAAVTTVEREIALRHHLDSRTSTGKAPPVVSRRVVRVVPRETPLRAENRHAIRRKTCREDGANTSFDSGFTPLRGNFTAFRDKNTQFNPTRLQFHSTFGCDFHRIEHVSSAQGV